MTKEADLDANPELMKLYNEAWELYAARCLWNVRRASHPTPDEGRFVASLLRQHGDMQARASPLVRAFARACGAWNPIKTERRRSVEQRIFFVGVHCRMDGENRGDGDKQRSRNRDRQFALSLSLREAFPLSSPGSFMSLLDEINHANRDRRVAGR